jgi:rhamnosyltransferase
MIIGIIVSYQPDLEDLILYTNEILEQVDSLLLIENGSNEQIQNQIIARLNNEKIKILLQTTNLGLAKAQNIGIQKGMELGGDYFLFLDDDSRLSKGSVSELKREFEVNPKLGIAACHILHENSSKEQKYWIKTKWFYKRVGFTSIIRKLENVNTVISSGSLVSKEVIEKCGLMREDYFIDYIDIEYCLRVRANGYSISVIHSARLRHKLGNTKSIPLGKLAFHPTNHNPERRYYMIRNRIWTWKLYALQFSGWFLIDLGNFFVDNIRVIIFENNKFQNFREFSMGLKDGIFKRVKKK